MPHTTRCILACRKTRADDWPTPKPISQCHLESPYSQCHLSAARRVPNMQTLRRPHKSDPKSGTLGGSSTYDGFLSSVRALKYALNTAPALPYCESQLRTRLGVVLIRISHCELRTDLALIELVRNCERQKNLLYLCRMLARHC